MPTLSGMKRKSEPSDFLCSQDALSQHAAHCHSAVGTSAFKPTWELLPRPFFLHMHEPCVPAGPLPAVRPRLDPGPCPCLAISLPLPCRLSNVSGLATTRLGKHLWKPSCSSNQEVARQSYLRHPSSLTLADGCLRTGLLVTLCLKDFGMSLQVRRPRPCMAAPTPFCDSSSGAVMRARSPSRCVSHSFSRFAQAWRRRARRLPSFIVAHYVLGLLGALECASSSRVAGVARFMFLTKKKKRQRPALTAEDGCSS